MFKKMLASFGKGSATVDLVLSSSKVALGSQIEGYLLVQGGIVDQTINKIEVQFYMELVTHGKSYPYLLALIPFEPSFVIKAGEQKKIPFRLPLPTDLPLSSKMVRYYFLTHLDIASGIDSSDQDPIEIIAPYSLEQVISAFYKLGFQEKPESRSLNEQTQFFAFVPTTFLYGKVTKLEFAVSLEEEMIRLWLELEAPGVFRTKEIKHEITIRYELTNDLDALVRYLRQLLEEIVENPKKIRFSLFSGTKKFITGALGTFATKVFGNIIKDPANKFFHDRK